MTQQMTATLASIDDQLAAIALARFGASASVNVIRYAASAWNNSDREQWYALAIKRGRLDAWQIVGRRRTRDELIELARSCEP